MISATIKADKLKTAFLALLLQMTDAAAHNSACYDVWERVAKAEKAELRRNTLRAIREIFGRIKTFNGTSTRKRRTSEQHKQLKLQEGQRYWDRIRNYKKIMIQHGWNPKSPSEIPQKLRDLSVTSLQLNVSLPTASAKTRSDFVFVPPQIHENWISETEADMVMGSQVQLYRFRAGVLKRAPKIEWYRHEKLRYSWGQAKSNDKYAQPFPDWMEAIAQRLPEPVNHAIVIRYSSGMKTYAPWHSDKCEELGRRTGCMKRGSSFFVISVGDPRTFELGDESAVIWQKALPHCSMIQIDAVTNVNVKHQVPQDKNWVGCRWSLIFRTIVTP
jgi:hypothetical protein